MDEQADRSSSSECDFELVRDDEDLRPKQASHDCWTIETLKTTFLQNIKSFSLSNSWLTVSLIVLLLGLTVEYKRVSNINELMSEQLKDLRRDYDQLKMHDTNQQLQILTELRALRDCGRPATIHEPKKVELKPVEVEPEAEHLKTEIKEEPKTTVKPKSMDIQETKVVGTKPIDEPNNEQLPTDEQKLINDPNNLECSRDCDDARNTRRSIVEFWKSFVSNPIDVFFSICRDIWLFTLASILLPIWKFLTIELILTTTTFLCSSILSLPKMYKELQKGKDTNCRVYFTWAVVFCCAFYFIPEYHMLFRKIRLLIVC